MKMRGLSKIAGYTGVAQTAVTRCMLVPCACMLLPSMLMGMMKKRRMLPTSKAALTAIELTVIYGSLQLAMPAALAVFPQVSIRHIRKSAYSANALDFYSTDTRQLNC